MISCEEGDLDKDHNSEDEEARPYVIVREIGKGSFATVYQGYHEVRADHLSQ